MLHSDREDASMLLELAIEDIETAVTQLNQFCELTGNEHLRRTFVATLEHFIGTGEWLAQEATAKSLKDEMEVEQQVADENSCEICGEWDVKDMGDVIEMFAITDRGERIERNVHKSCGEYRNMELCHLKDIGEVDGDPVTIV